VQLRDELRDFDTLDGWIDFLVDPPLSVTGAVSAAPKLITDAVSEAYPLPRTVTEAKAECDYWRARDEEMQLASNSDQDYGETALSLLACVRQEIVSKLFRYGLRAETLTEIEMRVAVNLENGDHDPEMMSAILADLRRLNKQQQAGRTRRKAP
jgi:hypothetical protein